MQKICKILRISGLSSCISDEYGKKLDAPEIKLGVDALLELDLRGDTWDDVSHELQAYPMDMISGCDSYYLVLDGDWDHTTQPKIIRTSGIGVIQSADGRTLLRAIAPNLAIPAIIDLVRNKEFSPVLNVEIGGFKAAGNIVSTVFALGFKLKLENRVYLGEVPGETVLNDPEFLRRAEILALIAEATRAPAANLSIGTVATGESGTDAEASVSGTPPDQTLNLVLPRGAKGDTGLSAYEVAVALGFDGTAAEWLEALHGEDGEPGANGEDGKGLCFDRTGSPDEKALYDDAPAGFKFAATTYDASTRSTTLRIWAKHSADYADWCPTPVTVTFAVAAASEAASLAPVEFFPPKSSDFTYFAISLSQYPNATVAAVTVETTDGELTLPYYSDLGVRKILKKQGRILIYFGSSVPAYTKGRIYFTQMIGATKVADPIEPDRMYYGYVTEAELTSVAAITSEMLTQATMTQADVAPLGKTSVGTVPAGSFVAVLVPDGYVATKFDGIASKVAFSDNGVPGTSANGTVVTLGGRTYKVYGEFSLTAGERFIYVDQEVS